MFDSDTIRQMLIALPILLFALTVHEYFHAWTALRFGDSTAKDLGRLTLNPIAHLDLLGLVVMVLSQFRFGWAKPVPVNPLNLKNYRVADSWIAAAGPLSNIGLAIIFGLLYRILIRTDLGMPPEVHETVMLFLQLSVGINCMLAVFNMIPLFPLDGSHILRNIAPPSYGPLFDNLQLVSPFILIGLVILGGVWYVVGPVVNFLMLLILGH